MPTPEFWTYLGIGLMIFFMFCGLGKIIRIGEKK